MIEDCGWAMELTCAGVTERYWASMTRVNVLILGRKVGFRTLRCENPLRAIAINGIYPNQNGKGCLSLAIKIWLPKNAD